MPQDDGFNTDHDDGGEENLVNLERGVHAQEGDKRAVNKSSKTAHTFSSKIRKIIQLRLVC